MRTALVSRPLVVATLFSATSTGVDEVYVAARDGSGLRRLTHGTDGIR